MARGLIRVCHLINDLRVGGAQVMLYKLLSQLDRSQVECRVVSLTELGPLADPLRAIGIPVDVCGMRRGLPTPAAMFRLHRLLAQARPDVIQTWLFHSDLLGGVASRWTGLQVPVVWNIRMSSLCSTIDKRSTRWTVKLCALLSRHLPSRIIVNSQAGRAMNAALGYASDKLQVIPNGFDTNSFRPSAQARLSIRRELGLDDDAPLIGLIGRFHPHKDHGTFLAAAGHILTARPDAHFLLCGDGIEGSNRSLREQIEHVGPSANFHLLGRREDVPSIQASLDVAVSSSVTEGFPNVIGEAMSCGIPCVVTDAGGSSEVVGDTGCVVPCGDDRALANGCLEILAMPHDHRRQLGDLARRRIVEQFSLERVTDQYANLWRSVADVAPATPALDARRVA